LWPGPTEGDVVDACDVLVDKDRIGECITRLFVATDNRDWNGVRACFADEVRFDMTSLTGGEPATLTPAEIAAGWDKGLRLLAAVHHQAGNYLVEVGERTATATCYATATHYRATRSGRNTRTFVGSYDFELAKGDDVWRITSFRFNLKYIDGNRDLESDG
jgi:SnoaL-like domain